MAFVAGVEPLTISGEALFIPVLDNLLLCLNESAWRPLAYHELTAIDPVIIEQHFLGYLGKKACWVVDVARAGGAAGYVWSSLRSQLGRVPEDAFLLAGRALQISRWYAEHQYCGRCGRPTRTDSQERAKICDACDLSFYPRLSPCIITLISRGDECLLARHARASKPVFSALAGFIEVGERPEDTVHREVREEVGIEVQSVQYLASQPWPFPGQLMLGFTGEYLSGDIHVDGVEIMEAHWFHYDCLPATPPAATLSGQLIAHFVEQRRRFSGM